MPNEEGLTRAIIGAAIEVHRVLGPGLLESAYQRALGTELCLQRIRFESEVHVPAVYKGVALDSGYRVDLIVEEEDALEAERIGDGEAVLQARAEELVPTDHVGLIEGR